MVACTRACGDSSGTPAEHSQQNPAEREKKDVEGCSRHDFWVPVFKRPKPGSICQVPMSHCCASGHVTAEEILCQTPAQPTAPTDAHYCSCRTNICTHTTRRYKFLLFKQQAPQSCLRCSLLPFCCSGWP